MQTGNFITRQSKKILESKQYAIVCAIALSVLPFASWLSVALIVLITLRKGAQAGFEVMIPALVIHSVPLMMLVSVDSAVINTLVTYVPCYIAALTLRKTFSWQAVFGVFFVQAFIGFLMLQLLAPHFIIEQFLQLKKILSEYQQLMDSNIGTRDLALLAQLFFGLQVLTLFVSAAISLLFARSIQARLFLPGGFKREIMGFRSGRLAFLILVSVSLASYNGISVALNLLPLLLCYFFVAGFNLAYFIFARKKQLKKGMLLSLIILIKPVFVISAYVILGSLDSLFNFRLYLPEGVRKSV